MGKITYSAFKKKVLLRIWPNSEPDLPGPENLQGPLEAYIQGGLAAIHQYNTCLQDENWDVHPQCATYYRCGLTVLPNRPPGVIRRIWTVAGDQCSPFTYVQRSPEEVREWAAGLKAAILHRVPAPVAVVPVETPPPVVPPIPGNPNTASYLVRRGDFWMGPDIKLALTAGTDMNGAVVRCQLRRSALGPIVYDFVAEDTILVVADAVLGTLTLTPSIPQAVTATLSGVYVADVEVGKPGVLNPITIFGFTLTFLDDISR